ncbi:MAG: SIMPL domain-containing protein [Gammaproteobacteria bacterium]
MPTTTRSGVTTRLRHYPPVMVTVLLLACFMAAVHADTDSFYNRVRLQAQQLESVSNDTMHVTLNTFGEAREPSSLATRINEDMEWALGIAKRQRGITSRTGSYQTYPVYKDNVLTGWRGEQSLELEGKDIRDISRLVGELQKKLQVKSMSFSVSDEKRTEVENRLIRLALDAFKARAAIVVDNLHATGYRIVEMTISTSSQRPPAPYPVGRMTATIQAESRVAVEAGESDVSVMVSGTVELSLP